MVAFETRVRFPWTAVVVATLGLCLVSAGALGFQGPAYPYAQQPQAPYGQMPPGFYGQVPQVPQGQYGQPMPWQYRPMAPGNARGVPPAYPPAPSVGTGQMPAQAPAQVPAQAQMPPFPSGYPPGYGSVWPGAYGSGYAPPAPVRETAPPRLEWSVDETRPYVQQSLLLRLDLFSPERILAAEPQIASGTDVLIQSLAGPTNGYRTGEDGRRELATSFVLVLTPLHTGTLEVAVPEIVGTRSGSYGEERFRAVSDRPIRLQVRPAMPSVRPWLPLESLSLRATVDRPDQVKPGQPVTLSLELVAVGGGAGLLPSLEDRVVSPDFRVYREQTLTDTRLSPDGRQLEGKRTEYYTLVPQTGGQLRLPEISVAWWDLKEDARQIARIPIRTLEIEGDGGPFRWPSAMVAAGTGLSRVWMPFAAVLLVLAGYWAGVFYRRQDPRKGSGLGGRLGAGARQAVGLVRQGAAVAARQLRPAPLGGRLRRAAPGMLPETSRLLLCLRQANRATTPQDWCRIFEVCARRWLRAPGQDSAPRLAERILVLRPRADRARVVRLMEQLDAALYGGQDIDFPRWKRDFMGQVGRFGALLRPRRGETRIRRARLPELNPRSA